MRGLSRLACARSGCQHWFFAQPPLTLRLSCHCCHALPPLLTSDGHAIVITLPRRVLLHRFNFKAPVRDLSFSPDDRFLAVTHGRKLQLWRAPGLKREFAPFVLHRTYTGHFDDITCIGWSPDSRYFLTGSKDMSLRIHSVDPIPGFVPITLSGHRSTIIGAYFSAEGDTIYSVSKDAAVFTWQWTKRVALPSRALQGLAAASADGGDDSSDGDDGPSRSHASKKKKAVAPAASLRREKGTAAASAVAKRSRFQEVPNPVASDGSAYSVLVGEWRLINKHFFKQDHAKVN